MRVCVRCWDELQEEEARQARLAKRLRDGTLTHSGRERERSDTSGSALPPSKEQQAMVNDLNKVLRSRKQTGTLPKPEPGTLSRNGSASSVGGGAGSSSSSSTLGRKNAAAFVSSAPAPLRRNVSQGSAGGGGGARPAPVVRARSVAGSAPNANAGGGQFARPRGGSTKRVGRGGRGGGPQVPPRPHSTYQSASTTPPVSATTSPRPTSSYVPGTSSRPTSAASSATTSPRQPPHIDASSRTTSNGSASADVAGSPSAASSIDPHERASDEHDASQVAADGGAQPQPLPSTPVVEAPSVRSDSPLPIVPSGPPDDSGADPLPPVPIEPAEPEAPPPLASDALDARRPTLPDEPADEPESPPSEPSTPRASTSKSPRDSSVKSPRESSKSKKKAAASSSKRRGREVKEKFKVPLRCRAIVDVTQEQRGRITFTKGTEFLVLEQVTDKYWRGELPDGTVGIFNSNHVELLKPPVPQSAPPPVPQSAPPNERASAAATAANDAAAAPPPVPTSKPPGGE